MPAHKPKRDSRLGKRCNWRVVRFCWPSVCHWTWTTQLPTLYLCEVFLFLTVIWLTKILRSSIDLGKTTLGSLPNIQPLWLNVTATGSKFSVLGKVGKSLTWEISICWKSQTMLVWILFIKRLQERVIWLDRGCGPFTQEMTGHQRVKVTGKSRRHQAVITHFPKNKNLVLFPQTLAPTRK